MPRTDSIRSEVQRLIHQVPFRKFVLSLENGERALIEHPENIAFEPEPSASDDFYVISGIYAYSALLGPCQGLSSLIEMAQPYNGCCITSRP